MSIKGTFFYCYGSKPRNLIIQKSPYILDLFRIDVAVKFLDFFPDVAELATIVMIKWHMIMTPL